MNKQINKTRTCIVVHRMTHHNHLIMSVCVAHRRNKIVVVQNYFRLVLSRWTEGARISRLADITELQQKYVYLFKTGKWFVDEPVHRIGLASVSLSTLKLFSAVLMALIGSLFFL